MQETNLNPLKKAVTKVPNKQKSGMKKNEGTNSKTNLKGTIDEGSERNEEGEKPEE